MNESLVSPIVLWVQTSGIRILLIVLIAVIAVRLFNKTLTRFENNLGELGDASLL